MKDEHPVYCDTTGHDVSLNGTEKGIFTISSWVLLVTS